MEIEQLKSELKMLGFTDEKLNELLELAAQEALDTALEDLEANVDDATMEELANLMANQPINAADATNKLNTIFEKAYGSGAEMKKQELVCDYLRQVIEETKQAKDLYARYQAGDPTAVALIKAQEGNPDVQKIMDAI